MLAQRALYHRPGSIRVAEHFIVPEADNAVAFRFDHSSTIGICGLTVLATVDLNYKLCTMAREIGNEVPDRDLSSKMLLSETFPEHAPKCPLGVGHLFSEPTCARDSASWRMMLHTLRSTANITPPQPLPVKGRG